jgi:hypothetical protein
MLAWVARFGATSSGKTIWEIARELFDLSKPGWGAFGHDGVTG